MRLKDFLDRILPSEGYKCWVEINKRKKVIQGFVTTTEELAVKLEEINSRGSDAYYACAAYRTADNRQSVNALAAKAFWLDIDAGEGKPYATADSAIEACDEFCNGFSLPLPGIVRSGGGIHAYWPLERAVTPEVWQAAAARLKLLLPAAGFHVDPSRTADIASILRPIGTHNHKHPDTPRPVELDGEDGWEPLNTSSFLEILVSIPFPLSVQPTKPAINSQYESTALPTNAALMAGTSKAFDATKGAAQGQRGSTLLKYAGEMVAKGYDEVEVIRRAREWNQLCTPPQDDTEVLRIIKSAFTMHARKHPPVLPVEEAQALPNLPHGYKWGPQQQLMARVMEMQQDGSEKEDWKVVSPYPVYLVSLLRLENGDRQNSYLFKQFNPTSGWHEFTISSEGFNTQNWYAYWFKCGGSVEPGMDKHFKTYVRKAEIMLRAEKEMTRYNQFGWKENDRAFLVGDILIRGGQPFRAYGTDKLTPLMGTMTLPKEGSLEEWTSAADKFFAPGMEAHGFALLASFAAPLMKFCAGLSDGGSILSLVSEESGRGKTPTVEAIASVWGDINCIRATGGSTENARMEGIVRRCHLPQVHEEMTMTDPIVAAESIKRFTTGTDRDRLNRDGSSKGLVEHYQTILITASNVSLFEIVGQVDVPASRRIFEIEVQQPANEAFSNLGGITREMLRCRAYAGRRWVQILTTEPTPQYLREHLTGLTQDKPGSAIMRYRHILETSAEHRFIVWLLACVDVAARLVTHYHLLHFDVERIMGWAIEQAYQRVLTRSSNEDGPSKLQRFLSEHVGGCLVVSDAFAPKNIIVVHSEPRQQMVARAEIKTQRLYILNHAMKRWCIENRMSFVVLGRQLKDAGLLLERSKPVTLGAGTMIPSVRDYCWEIDMGHTAMSGLLKEVVDAAKQENV